MEERNCTHFVKATLFDMENLKIKEFDDLRIFMQIPKHNLFHQKKDLLLHQAILKQIFPDFYIIDCQNRIGMFNEDKGFPDYALKHMFTDEEIFVEIKQKSDTVRFEQLKWFFDNFTYRRYILWIHEARNTWRGHFE